MKDHGADALQRKLMIIKFSDAVLADSFNPYLERMDGMSVDFSVDAHIFSFSLPAGKRSSPVTSSPYSSQPVAGSLEVESAAPAALSGDGVADSVLDLVLRLRAAENRIRQLEDELAMTRHGNMMDDHGPLFGTRESGRARVC